MGSHAFKRADWLATTNIYAVNLRQYTSEGSFTAFAKQLPRLKAMGVEVLWFLPITPIALEKRKGTMGSYYACSDYTAVNPEFGTMEDLKALLQKAQGMGFRVIFDWVANHTGWDHIWTISHPDYYKKDPATNTFKTASGMDDIIELDYDNPAMRQAMIDAMQFWVDECGIDGFRCDLAFWVQLDFWQEARAALEKSKTLFWFGEFDPIDNPEYYGAFDAAYCWTWMHKSAAYCKQEIDLAALKDVLLQYDRICSVNDLIVWFTTNHDENSWNGTEFEKYGDRAQAMAVFSYTWNGIPMLYSGQEMPNTRRLQFFEKDAIEWSGEYRLQDFFGILSNLKKNNPALQCGNADVITQLIQTTADDAILAYYRKNGSHTIIAILNLGQQSQSFQLRSELPAGTFKELFTGKQQIFATDMQFELPVGGYLLFQS